MMPECTVPGCRTKLRQLAHTQVCYIHQHTPGYCKCRKCVPERVADRADVRQVLVPEHTTYSGVERHVKISLKKEPWPWNG